MGYKGSFLDIVDKKIFDEFFVEDVVVRNPFFNSARGDHGSLNITLTRRFTKFHMKN